MSLNPIQFGTQVVDQFGRYILTQFPIADPRIEAHVRKQVRHATGGERFLSKGPYVFLNQPFEQGPMLESLLQDESLRLHDGLRNMFPFDTLYKHQEDALRAIRSGKHVIMATGTGSGKTEAFLLPIVNHCLKLRDKADPPLNERGLVAVLVYPMNALVNDQLKRLRPLLAGTGITFGRYTGETPEKKTSGQKKLEQRRAYSPDERKLLESKPESVPLPWEECASKEEIRERHPRILLTNYKQLEYLLVRDKDLELFRGAPIKFLVLDEVHTYTGLLGSEVACLLRRIRAVSGKMIDDILCIGTSATVAPEKGSGINAGDAIRDFAHRLFGVKSEGIQYVTERFKTPAPPPGGLYVPPVASDPTDMLKRVLEECRDLHLMDDLSEIPSSLLALGEELCGRKAPEGSNNMERMFDLLRQNRIVLTLEEVYTRPALFEKALPRIRAIGDRRRLSDEAIEAEIMIYLTLGAIVRKDDEPLYRPKLHYFIRGLPGIWISAEDEGWDVHFDLSKGQEKTKRILLPLHLCRACGQHYIRVFKENISNAVQVEGRNVGVSAVRVPDDRGEPSPDEDEVYITDKLIAADEIQFSKGDATTSYMCKHCGALHDAETQNCLAERCAKPGPLLKVSLWTGRMTQCRACGAVSRGRSPRGQSQAIRPSRTSTVSDVSILSQSMLTAMQELALQKLIVFADNRQDAAFQAGWMNERSKRFRLRHLLYSILNESTEPLRFDWLAEKLLEEAQNRQIVERKAYQQEDELTYIRWFLVEEFATAQQRRTSVENLGLARVQYDGLTVDADPQFFSGWADTFGISGEEVLNIVRIILDYYRRSGALSEKLLQRRWQFTDREVYKGLVNTSEHFRPKVLLCESCTDDRKWVKDLTKGWVASNGRSSAQEIVRKAVKRGEDKKDEFLKALWELCKEHELLVPANLQRKSYGHMRPIEIPGESMQINVDKVGIVETQTRHYCKYCRQSQSVPLPTLDCPVYNCHGRTKEEGRDEENYDVVQYTKFSFVPLKTYEHSAQVPKEMREEVENEFRRTDGKFNCIVCTPTLELGVDIGKLEMVLMRNVPPTPANYAQRSGRAGRRHRIAVVFTYCRGTQHDKYFFNDPPAIISGAIRIPAFSMQNEPLIRKHVHSSVLTLLREVISDEDRGILNTAFPVFIRDYFSESIPDKTTPEGTRFRFRSSPPSFDTLKGLLLEHEPALLARSTKVFTEQWPRSDMDAVSEVELYRYLNEMPERLEKHVRRLHRQIITYNKILKEYREKEDEHMQLTNQETKERRKFENARKQLLDMNRRNYTLTYLSDDGFFPGYALSRESCVAQCFDPLQELIRPTPVALREMTPANIIYANKNVFKVHRLDFFTFQEGAASGKDVVLRQPMAFDPKYHRILLPEQIEYADSVEDLVDFESFQLKDMELARLQSIDDRNDARARVAFDIYGITLEKHAGGMEYPINNYTVRYLARRHLRLINIGPKSLIGRNKIGFPICPRCGEARSPFTSDGEIERFRETHKKCCEIEDIIWSGLHVDMVSDVLSIGPYKDYDEAVNVVESILLGARHILDMGDSELESFIATDLNKAHLAVIYDPTPGGSGFLPQIKEYWSQIVKVAHHVVADKCNCEKACYSCLLRFRNQQYHEHLDRNVAAMLLTDLRGEFGEGIKIPPTVEDKEPDKDQGDSEKEDDFLVVLKKMDFPLPTRQYPVDHNGKRIALADYAFEGQDPSTTVLVFIDGTSEHLHGSPKKRQKDKLARAKLQMKGYKVLEITAQELKDETALKFKLQTLSIYLGLD